MGCGCARANTFDVERDNQDSAYLGNFHPLRTHRVRHTQVAIVLVLVHAGLPHGSVVCVPATTALIISYNHKSRQARRQYFL